MTARRLGLVLVALLATTQAAGMLRAQEPGDSLLEPALVELQLGRLVSQTVPAFRAGNDVLLPLSQFFDLAEIRYQTTPAGVVEALLQPGNLKLVVDPVHQRVGNGRREITVRPDECFARDGEVYLSGLTLAGMLGIQLAVEWSDLEVTVLDPGPLPIAKRLAREAARARFQQSDQATPDLALTLERPRWEGLVLDYSILSPSRDVLRGGAYATSLGLDVLGGSLEMGVATAAGAGSPRTDASWTGVWRRNRVVSQLRLGDGLSTGPHVRTVRGFSVSNAPYLRPSLLGDITYGGGLGPGWQVEAYRGGRLIGFDSVNALGQFSVDVPIQYGENPVDFVAYGPFGEVREFNRTYRVIGDILPQRRFEYGTALGACRRAECRATANVDLRYGLSRRWTVETGVDQFWRDSLPDLFHPYASLSGSLGNSWGVQLEGVANAVLRGALRFEPSTDLDLSAEYTDFTDRAVAPILTPRGRRNQMTLQAFLRPTPKAGSVYLDASLDRIQTVTGSSTSGRLGASFQVSEIRLLPAMRVQYDAPVSGPASSRAYLSLNSFVLPQPALGSFFGKFTARTLLETDGTLSPTTVSGYLSRPLAAGLRLETGAAWTRGGLGPTYLLTLSTELPSIRGYSTVTAAPRTPASATQYVQGSVLYNPSSRRMNFTAGPSLQRAGIAGRVFLDENGNGKRDGEEPLIPGVRVRVGMVNAISDSSGQYRCWDIPPYEPVLVVVDSLSLPSPLWVPEYSSISVEPGPNRFRTIDIPIAPGGSLEGRVVRDAIDGARGVPGVAVLVTELRTGVTRRLVTFSDGAFSAIGIKPGTYEVSVDPRALARLGLQAEPRRIAMGTSADGAEVSGVELRLVGGK
ncbi:MAG: hypothetical protein ACREMO_12805 [Gemmatimonadales bacterium]